ncbi:MAG: caspase family protein [Lewinellaceae bacterium]|nr:caspase family protein [Saprospiraceae bacterium]MCB9311956.1 caspase family protein [Lewinellaceae bacterium]HRW74783.1 caspase family protein [Saprospiraceae bacterium]
MNLQKITALSTSWTIALICLLAWPGLLMAQFGKKGTTRALVVGISEYQDEGIPDLRFAHRDAQAFADYLLERPVDRVLPDNLKLYINEEATGGAVHGAMRGLVKDSQAGDKVVIYFAGHGDVETLYPDEPGHLLVYDTPANNYSANSLRLDDVRRTVNALVMREVQVMIVTDACHAGKLAGSEVNGAQAATSAMAEQFNSETKILSCQPNEFSQEGEQWGSGRGVFSWYLIQGLTGMADADQDLQVTIKELQRYLEDKVELDVAPKRQTPLFIGDRNTRVAVVDEDRLLAMKRELDPDFREEETAIASREPETAPVAQVDTLWQNMTTAFGQALDRKKLISADLNPDDAPGTSAYDQLIRIRSAYPDEKNVDALQDQLIAKLQEDAQQAINAYLKNDPNELLTRWKGATTIYQNYPLYLEAAAHMLDQEEYLHDRLLALAHYFRSIILRLQYDDAYSDISLLQNAREEALAAKVLEPRSAFIPNELGLISYRLGRDNEANTYYQEAHAIAPTWAMPCNNMAITMLQLDRLDSAYSWAQHALELDSSLFGSYRVIGTYFASRKEYIEAEGAYLEGIRRNPQLASPLMNYGLYWVSQKKLDVAELWYQQALSKSHLTLVQLDDIARFYLLKQDFPRAEYYFKKILDREPFSLMGLSGMGETALQSGKIDLAKEWFLKAHSLYPDRPETLINLGKLAFQQGDLEESLSYYQKVPSSASNGLGCTASNWAGNILLALRRLDEARTTLSEALASCTTRDQRATYYNLACVEALSGHHEVALEHLAHALENGYNDLDHIRSDTDLQSIQELPAFLELLARY